MEQNMTFSKKILAGALTMLLSAGTIIPAANAEISASAAVATSYLWRGYDLGSGTPAVMADLSFSEGGAYAGVWISSGDTGAGTEFDLFAGFGGEIGDLSYDINVTNYLYPTGDYSETDGDIGDFVELILTLGYGPVSVSYYDNIAGDTGGYAPSEDYSYINASLAAGEQAPVERRREGGVPSGPEPFRPRMVEEPLAQGHPADGALQAAADAAPWLLSFTRRRRRRHGRPRGAWASE